MVDARRWHEARLLREFLAQVEVALNAKGFDPNQPGTRKLGELKDAMRLSVKLSDKTWPGLSLPVAQNEGGDHIGPT
jgi:hypothetical protein